MRNEFNTAIYKAWCEGRCGGNNHIPYENVLLASLVDRNEDNLADSQLRVDDDTLQQIVQTEADQTQVKLDAINANITAQGEAIVNAINSMKTTLQESFAELGTKLDALNTAIAGVDASVDEVTAAVNDVNTDTESIDAKMDTANTNITAVKTSVDAVKTAVDTANTNITAVKTSVDTANTKLDAANTKLDTIATNTTPAAAETDGGA